MEKTKMEKEIIKTIISNRGGNEEDAEKLSNALSQVVANYDYEAVLDWCNTIAGGAGGSKSEYIINTAYVTKANREKKILKNCGCCCYCECRNPLNDGCCVTLNESEYEYTCSECGGKSVFNFDIAPVPIRITYEPKKD